MSKRTPSMAQSATSAAFGGLCNVIAGQPFDTIKVRLQTQSAEKKLYSGPWDCLFKTIRNEGMLALYKGTSGAFVSIMTENIVLLTANTGIKAALKSFRGNDKPLTVGEYAFCGGVAGIFSATAITPAEVIKVRLQVSRGSCGKGDIHQYKGPFDCVRKTLQSEGIAGLFRGLSTTLARDLPFNFVFLGSYEAIVSAFASMHGENATKDSLTSFEILSAGGLAGTFGWAVIFPLDVVKSRQQTSKNQRTMTYVAHKILRQEGILSFYKGCSAALLRAFPANAGLFFGYEMAQRMLFNR